MSASLHMSATLHILSVTMVNSTSDFSFGKHVDWPLGPVTEFELKGKLGGILSFYEHRPLILVDGQE